MTHPGMAFVFIVGVGLATILYYMFNDSNNQQQQQQHTHGNNATRPPADPPNSWNISNDRSRRRRKDSNVSLDKGICTICLNELSVQKNVKLLPCRHLFHLFCIQNWLQQGDMDGHDACPNCRAKIEELR